MINLGIIGTPSDWLISCNTNKETVKEKLAIQLIEISIDEVYQNYLKLEGISCPPNLLKAKFKISEINKAYALYLAIKQVVVKYDLKGFTIRCFDLLTQINTTSCLALSLLNDEGIIATCEGDVPALLTMYLIKNKLNKLSFQANPSRIFVESNEIVLAHCTIPTRMCTSYKFDTHFESKIGVGIKGELELSPISILRLSSSLDHYVLLTGTIEDNLSETNLCRTQIKIKLDDNSPVNYFLTKPLGNHHIIIYGTDTNELTDYLNSLNITSIL